jgi:hypothetical protein
MTDSGWLFTAETYIPAGGTASMVFSDPLSAFEFETDTSGGSITITKYTGHSASVIIPEKVEGKRVTAIGKGAFEHCASLITVKIPDNVAVIGNEAFFYCTSLKTVTILNKAVSIGKYAFGGCYGMETVEIPGSVTIIGEYTFSGCDGLKREVRADIKKRFGSRVLDGE